MRKTSSSLLGLTTALAFIVAACGDDATGSTSGDSGDELTPTEVAVVLAALGSAFDSIDVEALQAPAAAPAQALIDIGETFDLSVPCDSGTLDVSGSLSGTIDTETSIMDVTMDVTWDPNGCVVSDGTNTFTVDGAPQVAVTLDMTTTQDALTVSGTETGGFSYTSSDGRSGSCTLDVTFSFVTGSTNSGTITGTVCGRDASTFQTLGT